MKLLIWIIASISIVCAANEAPSAIEEPMSEQEQLDYDHLSKLVPECRAHKPQSCYELALFITDESKPYAKHYDEAITYYTRACDKNHYDACANLSHAYSEGLGTDQDHFKARALSEKGCKAGHGRSCYNLATNYYNGHGVRIDRQRAEELFGRACDLKYQSGCDEYARMIRK